MRKEKNSFLIYYDFEEQTALLTDQQVGRLIRMVLAYEKRGELWEEQEPAVTMAFRFLKPGLDSNRLKYAKVCERNRKNRQKSHQSSPVVTSGTDTEPDQEPDPDTEPDTERERDRERERGKEKERENGLFEQESGGRGERAGPERMNGTGEGYRAARTAVLTANPQKFAAGTLE